MRSLSEIQADLNEGMITWQDADAMWTEIYRLRNLCRAAAEKFRPYIDSQGVSGYCQCSTCALLRQLKETGEAR